MINSRTRYQLYQSSRFSSFSNLSAYIAHNATQQLSDITGGQLPDNMQLPPPLHYFFTYAVVPVMTIMCRIGGVAL